MGNSNDGGRARREEMATEALMSLDVPVRKDITYADKPVCAMRQYVR